MQHFPDNSLRIASPLMHCFTDEGEVFRYTVAVIKKDCITVYTKHRKTGRGAASRHRNEEVRLGVRANTWAEFERLFEYMAIRMRVDRAVLAEKDLSALKRSIDLRRAR